MQKFLLCLALTAAALLPLPGQQPAELIIDVPAGPKPWSSLDFNTSPDQFQFVIVSDRTGGLRPGVFPEAMRKINLLQPEFVLSVGDLIQGYTEDMDELLRQWTEFDSFIDLLEVPFFYVPGNHDITNKVMQDLWKERFGKTYYHFVYKDVLFLCLDSEDQHRGAGRGSISDEQYEYIERTLAANPDVRWTLVFMHQPLWAQDDPVRWPDVETLLADREHSVFTGHVHHYQRWERNNGRYFTLATTGGGSQLRGPRLGEFDHVVWVTMTDQGPILANLLLSGIWAEDVVTAEDYDFISNLQRSAPIRIDPSYAATDDPNASNEVTVQINNPIDRPVRVRVDDRFSFAFTSSLSTDTLTIGPNDVGSLTLTLSPRRATWPEEAAVPLQFGLAYTMDNGAVIELPLEYRIGIEPRYPLPLGEAVQVDGKLDEWADLPYSWSADTTADMTTAFAVRQDEQYLYLAARVTDDELIRDTSLSVRRQDYLGFAINAEPPARAAMSTGDGWYRNSFALTIAPPVGEFPSEALYEDRYDDSLAYRWATQQSEGGYTLEVALPLSYLRERQGEDWQSVRINLYIQDVDTDQDREVYYWQPDWHGGENRIGSGTFFRATPED
jgi:hypothetical protein